MEPLRPWGSVLPEAAEEGNALLHRGGGDDEEGGEGEGDHGDDDAGGSGGDDGEEDSWNADDDDDGDAEDLGCANEGLGHVHDRVLVRREDVHDHGQEGGDRDGEEEALSQ